MMADSGALGSEKPYLTSLQLFEYSWLIKTVGHVGPPDQVRLPLGVLDVLEYVRSAH